MSSTPQSVAPAVVFPSSDRKGEPANGSVDSEPSCAAPPSIPLPRVNISDTSNSSSFVVFSNVQRNTATGRDASE